MKIVVNRCYGGYGLSNEAIELYAKKSGFDTFPDDGSFGCSYGIKRDDAVLVDVIEEFGEKANTPFSNLEIVEIPDDIVWEISEYDGFESVEEQHRSW